MTEELHKPTLATFWAGRILRTVVVLVLTLDAAVCLFAPQLLSKNMDATGFPIELAPVIGSLLAISIFLYLLPRTSVVGAILITGFLGGAISTHLRMGDLASAPQIISALLGVGVWGALYFRNGVLRNLLPLTARAQ